MEQFRNVGIIGRLGSTRVLETVRRLKRFLLDRHLHVILEDTIADVLPGHGLQTSSRKMLGEVCDLVIVVGSANSSNSVRLAEVALEAGAKAAYRVDDAGEIDEAWLDGVDRVSVTSGASVPEELVEGVLNFLSERGYPDARAVHSAEESLIFALPKELRRDLKARSGAEPEQLRHDPAGGHLH